MLPVYNSDSGLLFIMCDYCCEISRLGQPPNLKELTLPMVTTVVV